MLLVHELADALSCAMWLNRHDGQEDYQHCFVVTHNIADWRLLCIGAENFEEFN